MPVRLGLLSGLDPAWRTGNYRLAMGYGPADQFDHGGCVIGAFLYEKVIVFITSRPLP